jgi:hypothetical protein
MAFSTSMPYRAASTPSSSAASRASGAGRPELRQYGWCDPQIVNSHQSSVISRQSSVVSRQSSIVSTVIIPFGDGTMVDAHRLFVQGDAW